MNQNEKYCTPNFFFLVTTYSLRTSKVTNKEWTQVSFVNGSLNFSLFSRLLLVKNIMLILFQEVSG